MQQQIAFIREKVILANNPECKTYEGALIIVAHWANDIRKREYIGIEEDGFYALSGAKWNIQSMLDGIVASCGYFNLERVLLALKAYKNIQPLISYDKNNFMSISVIKEQEISEIVRVGIISNHLFSWQPNKTLENQPQETIQEIAEILGYNEIINNSN